MRKDLFESELQQTPTRLGPDSLLLPAFALAQDAALLSAINSIAVQAPFRHMVTPGNYPMSVAMTNCGNYGWISDGRGYRYAEYDPLTGKPWPPMPEVFLQLAADAALQADFAAFVPDACLINRYLTGARMSLHQDKDEQDLSQPIVSLSLGVAAVFQFGGLKRSDRPGRILLHHGDVVVWGGRDRLRYHGVLPLQHSQHPLLGSQRINLTLRKAR